MCVMLSVVVFCVFVTALCLKDMMREYERNPEYHLDIEKLRELLSKVTDEQKLNILQQTKNRWDGKTALHEAVYRDDAEVIATIISSPLFSLTTNSNYS